MTDSPYPVTLIFPASTTVVAGQWRRLADGRIETVVQRHELELMLALAREIPATVQEHLAAARQPAPVALPPIEPPMPPEPPEPRPEAVEVGEMVARTGQLVLM